MKKMKLKLENLVLHCLQAQFRKIRRDSRNFGSTRIRYRDYRFFGVYRSHKTRKFTVVGQQIENRAW